MIYISWPFWTPELRCIVNKSKAEGREKPRAYLGNKVFSKSALFCVLMYLTFFSSHVAQATIYECHTDQALEWSKGRMRNYPPERHKVFYFDDQKSILFSALQPSYPISSKEMQLIKPLKAHDDLIATSTETFINGQYVGQVFFRLRSWETKNIIFLYTWEEEVDSGHCIINNNPF